MIKVNSCGRSTMASAVDCGSTYLGSIPNVHRVWFGEHFPMLDIKNGFGFKDLP